MKLFVRILAGALLGWALLVASTWFGGYVAPRLAWPRAWWAHYPSAVVFGSETIIVGPFVLALGLLFTKLYGRYAVLSALTSMVIALLIVLYDVLFDPKRLMSTLYWSWKPFLVFLVVPPLIVLLSHSLRSNFRWSGP